MTQTTQPLRQKLTEEWYQKAAQTLGVEPQKAKALVDKSLPTLLEGLRKNTKNPDAQASLTQALQSEKHNGQILERNEDFFADHNLDEGDKILKHILGDTRDDIAEVLAIETKTEPSQAKKTLAALSPLVMGALGKAVQSEKLNADQVGRIIKLAIKERDLGKVSNKIALLIWDKNNNGDFKDDWFNSGKRWLAAWFNKK